MVSRSTIAGQTSPDLCRNQIEARTQAIGRCLADRLSGYRPSPLESLGDRAMVFLATTPRFRSHLLRFIDAFAGLTDDPAGRRTAGLLRDYLTQDVDDLPPWPRPLVTLAAAPVWPPPLVALAARLVVRMVASRFIADGGPDGALQALAYLRRHGRLPSFDILGEYVASEAEADRYRDRYLALIDVLSRSPIAARKTAAGAFAPQVSVKLSALTGDFNPVDPLRTIARLRPRLIAIAGRAAAHGIGVTLDTERYETRDLVLRTFFEVFGRSGEFGTWPGIGVVLQAYLRDAGEVAAELLGFARTRGVPFQVRLVKGAYWDYETVVAAENGWPSPVWEQKWQTDLAFERLSEELLAAFPALSVAIASHNLRSHAHAEAVRETLGLPSGAVEHQTLFRTAEGITRALAAMGWPVRDYVPLGELLPGMAYLVRRILENSSQAGFLLHSRSGESIEDLLRAPDEAAAVAARDRSGPAQK